MCLQSPADPADVDDIGKRELLEAEGEARDANKDIISGRRGKQLLSEISAYLVNTEHRDWGGVEMTSDEMHSICLAMICTMCDAWKRLVFPFVEQPKFELLSLVCDFEPPV
eukprot:3447798-Pyramimonas_sp.AAC.1